MGKKRFSTSRKSQRTAIRSNLARKNIVGKGEEGRHKVIEKLLRQYNVKSVEHLTDEMLATISSRLAEQAMFKELGSAAIMLMLLQASAHVVDEITKPKGSLSYEEVRRVSGGSAKKGSKALVESSVAQDLSVETEAFSGVRGISNYRSNVPPRVKAPKHRNLKPKRYHEALIDVRNRACPKMDLDSPWANTQDIEEGRTVIPVFFDNDMIKFSDNLYTDVLESGEGVSELDKGMRKLVLEVINEFNNNPKLSKIYRFHIVSKEDMLGVDMTSKKIDHRMMNGITIRNRSFKDNGILALNVRPTTSVPFFSLLDLGSAIADKEVSDHYKKRVISHEIGHLLSLKHPLFYGESSDHPPYLKEEEVSTKNTIMSYADSEVKECALDTLRAKHGKAKTSELIKTNDLEVPRSLSHCMVENDAAVFPTELDVLAIRKQHHKCQKQGHVARVLSNGDMEVHFGI